MLDPSAHDAFVQGICEGVDWVMEHGEWVPRYRDKFMRELGTTGRRDREQVIIEGLQGFLKRI